MAARIDSGSLETYGAVQSAGVDIAVPDAALLFTGDYSRAGTDLILTGSDGAKFVVTGYFDTDTPPNLISPDGAILTGDVVSALAGPQFPGQYAQAASSDAQGAQAIGKVQSVEGGATVVRANGVTETLEVGDPVFQGDVVQTGPGAKLGIGFVDGTVFSLSANARMVLNTLVYNPDGDGNSMLFSLVEGTFVFAAGKIAPTGDMKINTPVATMGIRGTSGVVEIEAANGPTNFKLIPDPRDGHEGSYVLYNLDTGEPMGIVDGTGSVWRLTSADGTVTTFPKSEDDLLKDAEAISEINSVYNSWTNSPDGPQAGPDNNPPSSGGLNADPPPNTNQNENDPNNDNNENNTPPDDDTEQEQSGLPPEPPDFDDLPPLDEIPEDVGVNVINGTPFNDNNGDGEDDRPDIDGTPGVDHIFGHDGNDLIFASPGNDVIDGGNGTDEANYSQATQSVVFDIVDGTVDSAEFGFDTVASIERFVGGSVNDTLIIAADAPIYFDGGDGTDTIEFAGNLSIDVRTTMIEAESIEVVDLNDDPGNTLTISADDINGANENNTLQIRGDAGDTVNLTSEFFFEGPPLGVESLNVNGLALVNGDSLPQNGLVEGYWQEAGTYTDPDDGTEFVVYEFFTQYSQSPVATAQVEQGIDVTTGETIDGQIDVGYYDMSLGQGDSNQVQPIQTAGYTAINIATPDVASLAGIEVLFLQNPSNSGYGTEFLSSLGAIFQAVAAGMTLIIHDRYVEDAESILPESGEFNIVRDFSDDDDIDVLNPNSTVTNGPGGIIDDTSLDGGTSSTHGFAIEGTLPEDSDLVLSTGEENNIVTFSYSYGEGHVVYSTIPLDYYLDGAGPNEVSSNFSDIYATNVVAYGAELAGDPEDLTLAGGEGNDIIIGNFGDDTIIGDLGNDTITGGGGSDTFLFESLLEGLDYITDFEDQETLDLSGILNAIFSAGDDINNFVQASTENGDTTVSVDTSGQGGTGPQGSVDIAVLQGFSSGTVNVIIDDGASVESVVV